MLRHPFEYLSSRYRLRTFFLAVTGVCVVLWVATFDIGRVLLGIFAIAISFLLMLACATWVLGTFGEWQPRANSTHAQESDDRGQETDDVAPDASS